MKAILSLVLFSSLFFVSCRKSDLQPVPIDESIWLQKERGVVVYSDFSCDYFVVETFNGYTIVQN
jgi:hypothetical protein